NKKRIGGGQKMKQTTLESFGFKCKSELESESTSDTDDQKVIEYRQPNLCLDLVLHFLDHKYANRVQEELETKMCWRNESVALRYRQRRCRVNQTFGDPGVSYTVRFANGRQVTRHSTPWSALPILQEVRDL